MIVLSKKKMNLNLSALTNKSANENTFTQAGKQRAGRTQTYFDGC